MMSREICKMCHQVNRVGFSVPDETWEAVVPESHQSGVVCLECFTRLGDEKLIPWDRRIQFYPVSYASHLEGEISESVNSEIDRMFNNFDAGRDAHPVIPDQPSPTRRSTT